MVGREGPRTERKLGEVGALVRPKCCRYVRRCCAAHRHTGPAYGMEECMSVAYAELVSHRCVVGRPDKVVPFARRGAPSSLSHVRKIELLRSDRLEVGRGGKEGVSMCR